MLFRSEEAAAATASLQDQAGELAQTVSLFKIDDNQPARPAGRAARGRLALT